MEISQLRCWDLPDNFPGDDDVGNDGDIVE